MQGAPDVNEVEVSPEGQWRLNAKQPWQSILDPLTQQGPQVSSSPTVPAQTASDLMGVAVCTACLACWQCHGSAHLPQHQDSEKVHQGPDVIEGAHLYALSIQVCMPAMVRRLVGAQLRACRASASPTT